MRKLIAIFATLFLMFVLVSCHWYSHNSAKASKKNVCALAQPVIVMSEDKSFNHHT